MATCAKPSVSGVNMRKCLDVVVLSDSDTRFAINLATAPVHLLSGELMRSSPAFPATRRLIHRIDVRFPVLQLRTNEWIVRFGVRCRLLSRVHRLERSFERIEDELSVSILHVSKKFEQLVRRRFQNLEQHVRRALGVERHALAAQL